MRKSIWDRRIPTLLGLAILLTGTIFTVFVANKKQLTTVNALNSSQPQNVRITNISDTSFTVSYTTESKVTGSVNFGKDNTLGQNALDDRDQAKKTVNEYMIHSITVKNLEPSTKYFFSITSGRQIYTTNGKNFEVTTAAPLDGQSNQPVVLEGNITTTSGLPPSEAIVYLTADNSQVISYLTDQNGHYKFVLSKVRTNDLSSFYNFVQNQTLKMLIIGDKGSSRVIISVPANKIPTITLSKDYDFTNPKQATPSANFDKSLSLPKNQSTQSAYPKIISPQKDEKLLEQQPIFKGTAVPGEDVQIVIHSSNSLQAVVTADSLGNWSYQPTTPLSPGTHTITITTKNSLGILQTLTQSFVVYASTETPTPTPEIVTNTITPTPNLINDNATISATSTGQLPQSGNPFIIIIGIGGLIVSFIGILLFLLAHDGGL
jgi:hypothetical protein